jgi:hypothetical protein
MKPLGAYHFSIGKAAALFLAQYAESPVGYTRHGGKKNVVVKLYAANIQQVQTSCRLISCSFGI